MAHSIITVATMKGGSGKSTLASCLAVHWQLNGRRSAIIDADPQSTIARLAAREKALGGVPVIKDATDDAYKRRSGSSATTTPSSSTRRAFARKATLACLGVTDFVLVPVKPSPFDVDRMLDTLNILINGVSGRRPVFRCVLTQTTRDSVIAKHIRSELAEAGFPVLDSEMTNRVVYAEAALWGATPSLLDKKGPAAREIAAIARRGRSKFARAWLNGQTGGKRMNKKKFPKAVLRTADEMREAATSAAPKPAAPDNVIEMMPKSEAANIARSRGRSPILPQRFGEGKPSRSSSAMPTIRRSAAPFRCRLPTLRRSRRCWCGWSNR